MQYDQYPRLIATIQGMDRRTNSPSGNPRYTVHTDKGSYPSATDGHVGFELQNREWLGHPVALVMDQRVIIGIEAAP